MTQDQRLSFLVEAFKADSGDYKDLVTPKDTSGRQHILHSLMNIRMPGTMPENVLRAGMITCKAVQEKGIVTPDDIPVCMTVSPSGKEAISPGLQWTPL